MFPDVIDQTMLPVSGRPTVRAHQLSPWLIVLVRIVPKEAVPVVPVINRSLRH